PFKAVVGEDGDTISLPEPQSDKRIGELAGPIVPPAKGQGSCEIACTYLVRRKIGIHGYDLAEMEQLALNHEFFPVHQGQPADTAAIAVATTLARAPRAIFCWHKFSPPCA